MRLAGTAVFFGTAFAFWQTVLALVVGAGLGWLSAIIAARIQAAITRCPGAGTASPDRMSSRFLESGGFAEAHPTP